MEMKSIEHRKAYLLAWMDSLKLNRKHILIWVVCALGMIFDSMDLQIAAFAAPLIRSEWHLTPKTLGYFISAASFGSIAGAYIFGIYSDRHGRIKGFQVTVGLFSIFTAACGLVRSLTQMLPIRFLAGVGIGGLAPIDSAVLTEYVPARVRGRMMALYTTSFSLGGIFATTAAGFILPIYGWRGLFIFGAIPALLVIALRYFVPETPRYLMSKGRMEEAERSVRWVADKTEQPDEKNLVLPKVVGGESKSTWEDIKELFSSGYRKRTILASILFFGRFIPYFGMVLWLPTLLGQYYHYDAATVVSFVFAYQISGLIGRLATLGLVDKVGRKPIIVVCEFMAAIMVLVFGFQHEYMYVLSAACIYNFFTEGAYCAVAPYIAELYPTRIRSTGLGWAMGIGRVGGAVSPMIVGHIVEVYSLLTLFTVFFACYVVVSLTMFFLGFETKGKTLEELEHVAKVGV